MENPPVNRLLQLLRQQSPDVSSSPPSPRQEHSQKEHATSDTLAVSSEDKNSIQPDTKSDIQYDTFSKINSVWSATSDTKSNTLRDPSEDKNSIQPDTKSDIRHIKRGTQRAIKKGTQRAISDIRYATQSGVTRTVERSIQPDTEKDIPFGRVDLSKGQRRVLHFLMANRTSNDSSQTLPIGYDSISRNCFLSRSGSRKVVGELCKKGLIRRLDIRRGETQGSVYFFESNIQYITKSSTLSIEKSNIQLVNESDTHSSSSSSKELLLQDLIFEKAFQDLNPRSLIPYLERFGSAEDLQNFLDMANACITASKEGHGKVIQNPHGFLFAQLRVGYLNPPEGYKSRRLHAQERRNQQLEEELAALRRLKEHEQDLQFELFKAQLTAKDEERLEHEAQAQVKPHLGLSTERQLEVHKDTLLRQWFAQRAAP